MSEPSLIFDKGLNPVVYLYLEIYGAPEIIGQSQLLALYLERDSLMVRDDYIDFIPRSSVEGINLRIPLDELGTGAYQGSLTLQLGDAVLEREFEFFVTESVEQLYAIMPDPEEEIVLLRYFSGNQVPTDWVRYDEATKKRYVSGIWKRMAAAGRIRVEDLLSGIRERLDYTNRNFRYFKEGWKTDMGRIYIRNGKPDEVEKDTTMDDTRYVRKDYQIWKYRGRINAVYVFVDMQMNGNHQLVYVYNDDMERSNPDYLRYLGDDFDTSQLNN
jgi:GWxTD domain-containing protein